MAKKVAPEEGVEENMFEAFKIMDEAVPAAVVNNETKVTSKKEEKAEAARLEAEHQLKLKKSLKRKKKKLKKKTIQKNLSTLYMQSICMKKVC